MEIPTLLMDWSEFARIPVVRTHEQQLGCSADGTRTKRICSTGQWLVMDASQKVYLPHVPGRVEHGRSR